VRFSLAKLIVWPRDTSKPPRVVTFAETGINLVTGSSRSGKSAIIKIIDYCLGSGGCSIPKLGPIRRSSAWYGIVVRTDEGYKLLARRDPDAQESTDDYMLVESLAPTVPQTAVKNTNRGAIKGLLGRLARLPQASADFFDSGSGYKSRASFGDMTSFMFQPQSIVANETVLFFEAEDEEHARKLREIFPLVLGAVDADTLVKQHRLAEVRRLLERRRRQFEALSGSIEDFAGAVRGRYLSAIDLGLLQTDVADIDRADIRVLIARLQELAGRWDEGQRPTREAVPFSAASRLADLRQRESAAAQQIASLRMRQVQLRELSQARQTSEGVLVRERDRLAPASWLTLEISETHNCPFCGSENQAGSEEFARLKERAAAVERQWRGIATIPPMLDAEEIEIRRAQAQEEERLRQIRAEKSQLEGLTTTARKADEERAVFVGKLLEFLGVQRTLAGDAGLEKEISDLEAEERELRAQVDAEAIAQRKEDALLLISKYAQHYGRIVELENNDAIIKLDTRELSIRVLSERGESAWLHQTGSGANHLGYHVATMLALHEFFISKPIPYVPSLLILDQPSQTQFPDDLDEDAEQEELRAVHKAFEAFDEAVDRTGGMLQIIVSEHAGKTVYAGIRRLTVVERWRRGRKLIPWHWDAEALEGLKGQRAEWAVEDLLDATLRPALATALSISSPTLISDIQIERATFADLGIDFQLRIATTRPLAPEAPGDAPRSSEVIAQTVRGSIRKDLSVSVFAAEGPPPR
jgi:hypothetical protein